MFKRATFRAFGPGESRRSARSVVEVAVETLTEACVSRPISEESGDVSGVVLRVALQEKQEGRFEKVS